MTKLYEVGHMITFNNGLGPLETKSGGGSREGVGWGDVMGGNFCFEGTNPFLKNDQIVTGLISHG